MSVSAMTMPTRCLRRWPRRMKGAPSSDGGLLGGAGVQVERILLAGDSPAAAAAGREAGARPVAVRWAAFQPEGLRQAGADFLCGRVEDLVAAMDQFQAC